MTNVFSLDSLKAAAEKKFAPVKIGLSDGSEVSLAPLLRLGKDDRKAVSAALDDVGNLDADDESPETLELIVEAISKVFNLITDKPAKLLKELDGPDPLIKLTLMSSVLNSWARETQLGEAGNSPA